MHAYETPPKKEMLAPVRLGDRPVMRTRLMREYPGHAQAMAEMVISGEVLFQWVQHWRPMTSGLSKEVRTSVPGAALR